jgi:pyocin large subunit-like protein
LESWGEGIVPFTLGFADAAARAEHHQKHKTEFGWISEYEYAVLADKFLGLPLDPQTQLEGRRKNGDIVRFDMVTSEFGILLSDGHIKTYFKADPKIHKKATNLEYYQETLK